MEDTFRYEFAVAGRDAVHTAFAREDVCYRVCLDDTGRCDGQVAHSRRKIIVDRVGDSLYLAGREGFCLIRTGQFDMIESTRSETCRYMEIRLGLADQQRMSIGDAALAHQSTGHRDVKELSQ